MPGKNEQEMRRMARTLRAFFRAGVTAAVRMTRRNLVKATPKATQFAAGWRVGVGGPPDIVPKDKPELPLYPLPGDHDTDREMGTYQLGDEVVLMSQATYIVYLNAGTSPQAEANFVQDAISESQEEFSGWRWDGEGLAA